jgi:hypothetical protein
MELNFLRPFVFVLLELLEDATCTISILALLENTEEQMLVVRESLVGLRILLMLLWHQE